MSRKVSVSTIICIFALLILTIPIVAAPENSEVFPLWGPYLTAASETSITVNWRTENATTGSVFYATEDYFHTYGTYNNVINDSEKELHHVHRHKEIHRQTVRARRVPPGIGSAAFSPLGYDGGACAQGWRTTTAP